MKFRNSFTDGILLLLISAHEVEVIYEAQPKQPLPEYSPVELNGLIIAVEHTVILKGLVETDWNESCIEIIKLWLLVTKHELLSFSFIDEKLTADIQLPAVQVRDIFYLQREPNHVLTLNNFHDDVTFGYISENVDGHMLATMEQIYAPTFFHESDRVDTSKAKFCELFHLFLVKLTALYHKLAGRTILYVPSEVQLVETDVAVVNDRLVHRLELVAEHWIGQMRTVINDTEEVAPYALSCPIDEYDFWEYRRKNTLY